MRVLRVGVQFAYASSGMTGRPHLAVAAGRCSGLGGLAAGRACVVVRRGQGGLRAEGKRERELGFGPRLGPSFFSVSFPFLIFF